MPNLPSPPIAEADLYRIQVRELQEYAMFVTALDGTVLSWNAGVENILGYSENEWIGQNACVIFTPEEKAHEVCAAEMSAARTNGFATDIRWHRRKDGSEFYANGFMHVIHDDSGAPIGFTKVVSDETHRKRLQDSLTESNAALEQFAYVASHDLQEPLRTLSSYAQLLGRTYQTRLDEDGAQMLRFIVDAANRMSTLVHDLLAYARAPLQGERPTSVALDEDLEAALSHLRRAIEESGGTVTHDALPQVRADRSQMVRLFQNLISNALKYHRPGVAPQVHVDARKSDCEWIIRIRDNGIGFDPAAAKKIFEPFHRLHSANEYEGNGVGLAICKRIVESHGGRIWAESQPGAGATFCFTLPDDPRPDPPPVRE